MHSRAAWDQGTADADDEYERFSGRAGTFISRSRKQEAEDTDLRSVQTYSRIATIPKGPVLQILGREGRRPGPVGPADDQWDM